MKVMVKNVDDDHYDHYDHHHVSQRMDSLRLSLAFPDQ